jgi:cyclic pyranopterin phosphate synthase
MLVDSYGRKITYLRVSVTDRCNLRCIYCRPVGHAIPRLSHDQILRYEEILRVVKLAATLGIKKVRITGGEPFVRKDIDVFINELSKISGIEEIAVTTNGTLLSRYLGVLKSAGVKTINVSLDTLKPDRYRAITGSDDFFKVWAAICEAKKMGFRAIKINVVLLKGINEDEIIDFALLSVKEPFYIRFIEHMPVCSRNESFFLVSGKDVRGYLKKRFEMSMLEEDKSTSYPGPARYYKLKGAKGVLGFIDPITSHFCGACNRIRLTADGHLRPCLLSSYQIDIKSYLRSGANDEDIKALIIKAVKEKPIFHKNNVIGKAMSTIGG